MYLYTPLDGRTVVVGEFIISSTGMQFDEPVVCLEEVIGKLLQRFSEDWSISVSTETDLAPEFVPEFTPELLPEPVIETVSDL